MWKITEGLSPTDSPISETSQQNRAVSSCQNVDTFPWQNTHNRTLLTNLLQIISLPQRETDSERNHLNLPLLFPGFPKLQRNDSQIEIFVGILT